MSIKWRLRQMMAKNDIWTGKELQRAMEIKAEYTLSAPSISSLINDEPKMIRTETLDALCTALDCKPSDLIQHKASKLGKIKVKEPLDNSIVNEAEASGTDGNNSNRSMPPI